MLSAVPKPQTALAGLPFDPADDSEITAFRQQNLGRQLVAATAAFEALVRSNLEALGLIEDLSAVHVATARSLDLEGNRLSELAERAGISKQYVGTVVRDLRDAGIVKIETDPSDGRARLVKFTTSGRGGLLIGLQVISQITAMTEEAIGPERVADFLRTSRELRELWSEMKTQ